MTKLENQTFKEMIVILDDHAYIDCQFDRCTLYYAGGPCILIRTKVRNCQFNFLGPANSTIQVLATLGMLKTPPEFHPGPMIPN